MSIPTVATGHAETTRVAVEILRAGGNAFDAAIGAVFASSVSEPTLTSLAGGGFLMAAPHDAPAQLWDFFVDAPGRGRGARRHLDFQDVVIDFKGSTQIFHIGWGSVAVPGCLAGLVESHRALGRMPLGDVVRPAVDLAREGVSLNRSQAFLLEILEPVFAATPECRAIYARQGSPLREGDRVINLDLASFLQTLPDGGAEEFYRGTIAAALHEEMSARHGLLSRDDLAAFQVERRAPLPLDVFGARLFLNPAPSLGGDLIALSLRLLEAAMDETNWEPGQQAVGFAAIMEEVDRQRDAHAPLDLAEGKTRILRSTRGTTHVSVADAAGNLAALSTSNGAGSGIIVPGTGILLNNMLGEDDLLPKGAGSLPAGGRISSMMCPIVGQLADGSALALGSGGSKRIRTALFQVLARHLAFGQSLKESVHAPRLHWDGEHVQVEPGWHSAAVAGLRDRWTLNEWSGPNVYFGGVHAVDTQGEAAADPRRGGAAWVG